MVTFNVFKRSYSISIISRLQYFVELALDVVNVFVISTRHCES